VCPQVLQALTRKFDLSDDVHLEDIAARVPQQCTGADAYGLCADAWMHALRRTIAACKSDGRGDANDDLGDADVVVRQSDFVAATSNMVPSLTLADLDRYDALKAQYSSSGGGPQASKGAAKPQQAEQAVATAPPPLDVKGKGLQLPARRKAAPAESNESASAMFL